MANVKIKAPVGYHFMVNSTDSKDFYLMKTASTGFKKHNVGGYSAALSIDIEVKGGHINLDGTPVQSATTQRTATATSSTGRTTTTRTVTPTRATRVNYSGGGGGSSSGSSGGGY